MVRRQLRLLLVAVIFVLSAVSGRAIAENPSSVTQKSLNKLKLLNRTKVKNINDHRFDEAWLQVLKDIVDQGSHAVPELIAELDQTNDETMLSCLGFVCRAMDDKRTVPALIRAFPRTLTEGGFERAMRASKPELVEFARSNCADSRRQVKHILLHRSAKEIGKAIQKLTKYPWVESDDELFSIYLVGSSNQKQLKNELFQRTSKTWAAWWETHWSDHIDDEAYRLVRLPPFEQKTAVQPPSIDGHFRTGRGSNNALLQPLEVPDSRLVLFDLDLDRFGSIPNQWRDAQNLAVQKEPLLRRAADEGFDLIGTEVETPGGERVIALRSIGIRAWELKRERWKMHSDNVTVDSLIEEGIEADDILMHRDVDTGEYDAKSPATFLVITREGTIGLLFVGVEVRNDRQKLGIFFGGDNELQRSGCLKGRRFAFTELQPKD